MERCQHKLGVIQRYGCIVSSKGHEQQHTKLFFCYHDEESNLECTSTVKKGEYTNTSNDKSNMSVNINDLLITLRC